MNLSLLPPTCRAPLILLIAASLCWSNKPVPAWAQAGSPPPTAKTDPFENVEWHDVSSWGLEGREWNDAHRLRHFDRLPAEAEKKVPSAVWNLSRDSAGMMTRFRTNASALYVDYKLLKPTLSMAHMPATGVSGVDFYARDSAGKWRWVGITRPNAQTVKTPVLGGFTPGEREFAAYLPLYNGVDQIQIGVPKGSSFEPLAPRRKPIVFYGTSITHGACASRPGMVHTAILGRRLDRPVVNLGFSGNGRMDASVGEFLVQIDAAAFVIDCLPNMQPATVAERCIPLVEQIRATHPTTPIVLVEDRRFTNDWITPAKSKFHDENHAALQKAFARLQERGVKNLHYLGGDSLYGTDSEGATDASHASDLGFMRQADAFEPVLRKALGN